jgi:mRNA interferase MazF
VVSLAAGKIVVVPFPFSDLSQTKRRPALVLGNAGKDDWILCQITSNPYGDDKAYALTDESFAEGSLNSQSYARPGKLFTASKDLILYTAGSLKKTHIRGN